MSLDFSVNTNREHGTASWSGPGTANALASGADIEEILDMLIASFLSLVPGADCAKVSVFEHGQLRTVVASSELAASLDTAQQVARQGPCLDAIDSGTSIRSGVLGTEARWPRFGPHAATAGVRSVLSCPIAIPGAIGGTLTVFGFRAEVSSARSESIGTMLAERAGGIDTEPYQHAGARRRGPGCPVNSYLTAPAGWRHHQSQTRTCRR